MTPRPSPDELHYSAKNISAEVIGQGVKEWKEKAEKTLEYELAEEIQAGEYDGKPLLWKALVHSKTLDLLDSHSDMSDAISMAVITVIEDEALYHYAGCETAEEFFNAIGSQKKGSQRYDLLNLARIAQWCKSKNVQLLEPSDNTADHWVSVSLDQWFVSENKDGVVRQKRLRAALPELRRVTGQARENYVEVLTEEVKKELLLEEVPEKDREAEISRRLLAKQKELVTNILNAAADHTMTTDDYKIKLNARDTKPVIVIYQNGNDSWHVREFVMTDRQKERFFQQNQFSAIIKVENPIGEIK